MSATALVNEVYLKLNGDKPTDWQDRVHFFRVAARAMRQLLLNYGAMKKAARRGGGAVHDELEESRLPGIESVEQVVALEQALKDLEALDDRARKVFECRRLGGLSIAQTAEELGISVSTVKRDSEFAEAWLKCAILDTADDDEASD